MGDTVYLVLWVTFGAPIILVLSSHVHGSCNVKMLHNAPYKYFRIAVLQSTSTTSRNHRYKVMQELLVDVQVLSWDK